jgi:hypothetical protein
VTETAVALRPPPSHAPAIPHLLCLEHHKASSLSILLSNLLHLNSLHMTANNTGTQVSTWSIGFA